MADLPEAYDYHGDTSVAKNSRFVSPQDLPLNERFLCKIERVTARDNLPSFDGKSIVPITLYLVLSARKDLPPEILRKLDGKEIRVNGTTQAALDDAFGPTGVAWRGKLVNVYSKLDKNKVVLRVDPAPNQQPGPAAQRVAARVQPTGFDPAQDADLAGGNPLI